MAAYFIGLEMVRVLPTTFGKMRDDSCRLSPISGRLLMTRPAPGVAATERFVGQLLVRLVDEAGLGPALDVSAPDERVSHASIARAADGTIGVAYTTSAGVSVRWLRCADR